METPAQRTCTDLIVSGFAHFLRGRFVCTYVNSNNSLKRGTGDSTELVFKTDPCSDICDDFKNGHFLLFIVPMGPPISGGTNGPQDTNIFGAILTVLHTIQGMPELSIGEHAGSAH